jgi:hypothetical protein
VCWLNPSRQPDQPRVPRTLRPMRVMHIVSEPGARDRGVPQKVASTVACWRRLGVNTEAVDLATMSIDEDGFGGEVVETRPRFGRAGWVLEMERRGRRLLELLDKAQPDIVYSRELVWSPAIERIARRHRLVLEINSDRARELEASSRSAAAFWRATAPRIRRRAAGIVAVTNELLERTRPAGVPGLVLPNGTDVPEIAPTRVPSNSGGRSMFLMIVGRAAPWHGLDRFSMLAEVMPECEFVVCGDLSGHAASIGSAVRREPPRTGPDLARLLHQATVAVGSLAIARNDMREACPLKSRTCLAAGLPLVYGYVDPALAGDEPFALRLNEADWRSGPPVERIRRFLQSVVDEEDLGMKAWTFARDHLDRTGIEVQRLAFFRSLAERERSAGARGS